MEVLKTLITVIFYPALCNQHDTAVLFFFLAFIFRKLNHLHRLIYCCPK
jgi:hypothetical protein